MSKLTGFSPKVHHLIRVRGECIDYGNELDRCEGCGKWFARGLVQHHHRRPRGAGGSKRLDTNLASNGLALCGMYCHPWAESNREEATGKGWLISQHAKNITPADVPVELWDGTYLLDDLGGKELQEVAA